MKITCRDPFDVAKYEKELRAAGWCLPCQGYGQNWDDGLPCSSCGGTGRSKYRKKVVIGWR
jgi:hypothetical protein